MIRSPEKSGSLPELSTNKTPPTYISERNKRKRPEEILNVEFDSFKQEMREMLEGFMKLSHSQMEKITPTLKDIQSTNSKIEESINFLAEQNDVLKKKIEQLESEKKKDREYITLLEEKVEDLQRNSKKSSIELKNVPKQPNESKETLSSMLLNLSKSLGSDLTTPDILDIYRVRYKDNNGPIIAELSSTFKKSHLLKAAKTYNARNRNNKLNGSHLGIPALTNTPIYLSEHLTPKAARLYYLARELTRNKSYKYCWTAYGRVYVRQDDNSPVVVINNESQVTNLINKI
ncbi:unnamed protein product [Plutella xylostella]|uniref:(diamondback moth) hypothetical protein n=1 Tax=Plutella xylostella TaxID=51655 RepID=A0A8S4F6U4_PLUXY|nr:unnamed protein product [Plutella xylostella]